MLGFFPGMLPGFFFPGKSRKKNFSYLFKKNKNYSVFNQVFVLIQAILYKKKNNNVNFIKQNIINIKSF